eukprot:m.118715 g.118715  ORF g.118715 m.118715 type:complete len:400 (+) comp15572_c0_seq1:146-1345(+)
MAALIVATLSIVAAVSGLNHGWTIQDMMFVDYRSPLLLNDTQAKFAANNYAIISLEKCTGQEDGYMTEDAIFKTAQQLKSFNSSVKVLMYWSLNMQATVQCYQAGQDLTANHSDYFLRDDYGNLVPNTGRDHTLDYTRQDVRDWWVNVPLALKARGAPIDGVLADGTGSGALRYANISLARRQALVQGSYNLTAELMHRWPDGLILGNGIAMYPQFPDHFMPSTHYVNGVMTEHFAAFESRDSKTGQLNITRVKLEMDLIAQVAADPNKTVVVDTWPGPMVAPFNWAKDITTPTTNEAIAQAMLKYFPVSLAAYLTLAEANIYFQYIWWYPIRFGAIPCPDNPSACAAPTDWYNTTRRVGAPLGKATLSDDGTVYTRQFEHATSVWNMMDELKSSVEFH